MADIRKKSIRRDIKTAGKYMPASSRIRRGVSRIRNAAADDNGDNSNQSPDGVAAERYLRGIRSSRIAAEKAAGRTYRNAGEVYAVYQKGRMDKSLQGGQTGIRTESRWKSQEDLTGGVESIKDAQIRKPRRASSTEHPGSMTYTGGGSGPYTQGRRPLRQPAADRDGGAGMFRKGNVVTISPRLSRGPAGGRGIRTPYAAYASEQEGAVYTAGRDLLIRKHVRDTLAVKSGAGQQMAFAGGRISQVIRRVFGRLRKGLTTVKTLVALLTAGASLFVTVLLVCILFGAAFFMFGDTSTNSCTPVSAEVEAYEPLIRQYAQQYGIGEYVELIKAIMMQESTGLGSDPMMASESGYNRKYPHTPGAITDPSYSIECGVQTIRDALKSASVENPVDMEHIRLALQGYNFGNGYVDWAVKRDGGYTVENAAYFSDMMAKRMGWAGYGDKNYVSNVLRFYPYGRYNYGIGNSVITQVAAAQVGNRGGQPYWSWYGYGSRVDWCAIFVSWCGSQCGYLDSGILPRFAVVSDGAAFFKEKGQWQPGSYTPAPGDIIFFNWDGDSIIDHVGIVESFDGTYVNTIEGNSGDACKRQQYLLGESCIVGYGVPKY